MEHTYIVWWGCVLQLREEQEQETVNLAKMQKDLITVRNGLKVLFPYKIQRKQGI
jgi:hypothetical protein